MKPLSLYELNHIVRNKLSFILNDTYWLTAELCEVRHSAGGHCYVEFVEKQEGSNALIAKAKGNIWRNVYPAIAWHFESVTGQQLRPGIKVLVEVKPDLHELYGYSLTITDIDPVYTLGDIARRRKEIIAQLQAEGVYTMNKELPLPRPLRRIAIISSATAAGYGDFCHQIAQSGFPFELKLFSATMQGDRVEDSIIQALNDVAEEADYWDAVAIIRGGGAVSDLNGFDTYLLATNVAQFPLPVLTGIGHERDDTVIDLVAHTRLKTPTAVATFLIQARQAEVDLLDTLRVRQQQAVSKHLERARTYLQHMVHRMESSALHYTGRQREKLLFHQNRLENSARGLLQAQQLRLNQIPLSIERQAFALLSVQQKQLDFYQQAVRLAHPERILNLGYSITYHDGKVVEDPKTLKKGDRITTRLKQGDMVSIVE